MRKTGASVYTDLYTSWVYTRALSRNSVLSQRVQRSQKVTRGRKEGPHTLRCGQHQVDGQAGRVEEATARISFAGHGALDEVEGGREVMKKEVCVVRGER